MFIFLTTFFSFTQHLKVKAIFVKLKIEFLDLGISILQCINKEYKPSIYCIA